jgi:hypothetical protein
MSSSLASAALPRRFVNALQFSCQRPLSESKLLGEPVQHSFTRTRSLHKAASELTHPAKTKLCHNPSSSACLCAPLLDCNRSTFGWKLIELQLGLMPDSERQGSVSCDEFESPSKQLMRSHALTL